VLFVTVWPYPSWPYSLTPYIFLATLVVGAGYMIWLERRRPGALQRGATMLAGWPADAAGDVDWDASAAPAPQADA
jgi:hypothetical protein